MLHSRVSCKRLLKTAGIFTAILGVLQVASGTGFTQGTIPGYISPPGTEYPYPPPGAQPPVIYDSYQEGFVNPEAHEIQKAEPQFEIVTKDEEKTEEEKKHSPDLGGGQWKAPEEPWGLDNPEAHELQKR